MENLIRNIKEEQAAKEAKIWQEAEQMSREAFMHGFQSGAKALKHLLESGMSMKGAMEAVQKHKYLVIDNV